MRNILCRYLSALHVPHTDTGVRKVYDENPNRRSMIGLVEMLQEYGVSARAQHFDTSHPAELALPVPCIVVYNDSFVILSAVSDGTVTYEDERKKYTVPLAEFIKNWNGIALRGYPDASSAEPEYKSNVRKHYISKIKSVLYIIAVAVLFIGIVTSSTVVLSWWGFVALALNLFGLYLGYLLILKQLHVDSRAADHLCSIIKNSHCGSPKLEKASTVFGMVSLAEIGYGYFLVNTLIILFFPSLVGQMALFTAVGLLASFWSVWYQKTQAKVWCTLCLLTFLTMWILAGIYLIASVYSSGGLFSIGRIIMMASVYGVAILTVSYFVELINKLYENEQLADDYNELRTRPDVMRMLIDESPVLDKKPELRSSLIFGNPASKLKITAFANPYCGPCAVMHAKMALFLSSRPNVEVRYTFTYFTEEKSVINRYLIAAYLKYGPEKAAQIFNQWYEIGRDVGENFFTPYNLDIRSAGVDEEFERQKLWREETGLTATPVLLVNGHKLPHRYTVDDLVYIADSL